MTIYQELHHDHQKVLNLLDKLLASEKAEPAVREKWIAQIRDELVPHSRAEEAVLYNSIRQIDGAGKVVAHAYQEHLEAETLLRNLQVTGAVGGNWLAVARKLKEALRHHIAEEEGKVFSAGKKLFTEEEAMAMNEVFQKMKPLIRKQTLFGTSIDMLVNLMPERLREIFGKLAPQVTEAKAS